MRSRPNLLLIAAMVLFFSAAAQAQPLPKSATEDPIDSTKQGVIDAWVKAQVANLNNESMAPRKTARDNLVAYANLPGAAPGFQKAYSQSVTNQIGGALTDKDPMVRLNAMIIVGNLPAPSVDQVIAGLADKNPGVRYAAGMAVKTMVAHAANAGGLPVADQKKLLAALAATAAKEPDFHVAEALLTAIANLTIPDAIPTLFDTIDKRLAMHVVPPGPTMETLPLAPERAALSLANGQIVGAYTIWKNAAPPPPAAPGPVPKQIQDNFNGLMKISTKLMDVASNRGGLAGLPAAAENDAALTVKEMAAFISYGATELYPATAASAKKSKNNIDALTNPPQGQPRNWTNIRGEFLSVKTLLTGDPIKYAPADVTAPKPPPPPAPPPPPPPASQPS